MRWGRIFSSSSFRPSATRCRFRIRSGLSSVHCFAHRNLGEHQRTLALYCFEQHFSRDPRKDTTTVGNDVLVMPEPVYFGGTVDRSIGSREIVCEIERRGRKAFALPDRHACGDSLVKLAGRGDRIVVMGARDDSLSMFAHELLRRLAARE
jgi:hypothetical protein